MMDNKSFRNLTEAAANVIAGNNKKNIKLPRQLEDPKSEWPEHEKSGHTVAESVSLGESADSTELHLFTVNHPGIHASRMTSIHKNLRNKMAKGTYDSDKAHKAFMYAAKDGADAYHHEHGHKFHKSVHHDVATTMRNEFESEAKDGQHDHHLYKKYRKKNLKDHVELSELSRKKLIDIINTTGAELAGDLHTDKGKVTPRTNKLARVKAKAKKKLDRKRIDPEKFGTGHVYKPDKIQGKWVDTQEEISPNSRKVLEIMAKKKKDYPKQSERAGKMLQRIDGESNPTKVNDMMARVQKRKAERKAKYDAMTPEEQKADDRMWAEVDADKIKHNWRESVDLERWRSALESGEPVVLENEEIISLMRLNEKKDVEPLDEINRTKLKNRLGAEVARVTYGDKKHTPMTNKQAKLLRKLEREENQESEEIDEGKGMGHLQKMFFKKTMQTALPKVGKKVAAKFVKSAAKAAKEKRNNQHKVKTKGGGEETVSGEDLKAAGEVYDREDLESRIQRRLGPDNR